MDFASIVSLFGLGCGLIAGLCFCFGTSEMKISDIVKLGGTYWDGNTHTTGHLIQQKANYLCGGLALIFGFLAQFVAGIPGQVPNLLTFQEPIVGGFIAFVGTCAFGGMLYLLRQHFIRRLNKELRAVDAKAIANEN